MAKPYLTQRDCAMRVDNTLCTYAGKPVHVRVREQDQPNVIHIMDVTLWARGLGTQKRVNIEDPLFSVTPVELGYINHPSIPPKAWYLYRQAQRRPRQGLSTDNINVMGGLGMDVLAMLGTPAFVDMWADKYPTFKECLDSVLSPPKKEREKDDVPKFKATTKASMAFHKHLCIEGKPSDTIVSVYMQGVCIGVYCPRSGKLSLNKGLLAESSDRDTQIELINIMLMNNGVKINDYTIGS